MPANSIRTRGGLRFEKSWTISTFNFLSIRQCIVARLQASTKSSSALAGVVPIKINATTSMYRMRSLRGLWTARSFLYLRG